MVLLLLRALISRPALATLLLPLLLIRRRADARRDAA
jgi:hypothetical protein